MGDGTFEENFTWFEWGFVTPSEMPHEDRATPLQESTPRVMAMRLLEDWNEDHRWPT